MKNMTFNIYSKEVIVVPVSSTTTRVTEQQNTGVKIMKRVK